MRPSRLHMSPASVLACLLSLSAGVACVPNPQLGTAGERGRVYFNSSDTELVFKNRLMVGSVFQVGIQPVDSRNDSTLVAGTFRSSDPAVLDIVGENIASSSIIEMRGPGEAYLEVIDRDGEMADRIQLSAAVATSLELGDGTLNGSAVDPRIPARFATLEGELPIFLVGLDRCGTGLLPVNVAHIETPDAGVLDLAQGGANDWMLSTTQVGAGSLTIHAHEQEWVSYDVQVVAEGDLTKVEPWISAFDEDSAQIWAQAYAGNDEVVGLSYTWQGSERVILKTVEGPFNVATVERTDGGVAEVSIDHGGVGATFDLLTATTDDVKTGRVAPPSVAVDPPSSACGGGNTCDPFLAGLVGVFWMRRRWRP